MSKIFHPEEYRVYKFNGNAYTCIYLGYFYNLEPVDIEWEFDKHNAEFTDTSGEYITLKALSDQLEEKRAGCVGKTVITVFFITKNANSFIYTYENGEWFMFDTNYNMSGGL